MRHGLGRDGSLVGLGFTANRVGQHRQKIFEIREPDRFHLVAREKAFDLAAFDMQPAGAILQEKILARPLEGHRAFDMNPFAGCARPAVLGDVIEWHHRFGEGIGEFNFSTMKSSICGTKSTMVTKCLSSR